MKILEDPMKLHKETMANINRKLEASFQRSIKEHEDILVQLEHIFKENIRKQMKEYIARDTSSDRTKTE
jgi:hypothetical protein